MTTKTLHYVAFSTAIAIALTSIGMNTAVAADAGESTVTLIGYLDYQIDDSNNPVSGELVVFNDTEDTVYSITMDANGKKLADLDGDDVQVTGRVTTKGDSKWLTVKGWKKHTPKEADDL